MFAFKKKYFLIIDNIRDINLNELKTYNKFYIIYRNSIMPSKLESLADFRKKCKLKNIKFYIANDFLLCNLLKTDGVYLSASNKSLKFLNKKKNNFDIIGSAHNFKEINLKIKQGCSEILLSKLFRVDYDPSAKYLGLIKFNNYLKIYKKLIPLGGIKKSNINKLKIIPSDGFAVMSGVKKKPAISSRLF